MLLYLAHIEDKKAKSIRNGSGPIHLRGSNKQPRPGPHPSQITIPGRPPRDRWKLYFSPPNSEPSNHVMPIRPTRPGPLQRDGPPGTLSRQEPDRPDPPGPVEPVRPAPPPSLTAPARPPTYYWTRQHPTAAILASLV